MKIQRLMLAVLAVCGTSAALAQSSVTIYGRVNTSIEQQKLGDNKVTGMFNNASRIGFKGVEDLGGGLKAGFQLEAGFGSDDGSGPLNFGRQSEVNLSGNWGMVRLGNFTPESYYATADYISMHNHDTGSSADALYEYGIYGTANKIAYRTPEMGGFWAEAAYQFGEKLSGATTGNKNAWDLAANYNNGPLGLGLGYSQASVVNAGVDSKIQQVAVRGSYAIGALTLGAYYQYAKDTEAGNSAKRHAVRLAAMYTMGASEFHVNVGRANKWKPVDGTAATQWTLGYNYNLSKRTKVYTYYTRLNNGDNINYATGAVTGLAGNNGDNFSSFAVGVRHNF